ncbi:MaoC family dehydratase [Mesorhizobium sp. CU2]|uniref:MaoC family dehydratase n=1 Tax=unclassified Mesorhizobium TaxID=325217 RepID=UPI0011266DB9|nr:MULTISPECIES: MaoC family dehydratase [unclassified Mesorhizobium]TPN77561.1 MaoC family dehydratase [Mesorhizobium sp. CU3]TPO16582.1 MaoC family dehydratase [Mesorhizobium sp. CU2]
MTGKTWAYEDFVEGASLDLGSKDVSAAEIIEFASEFDPQPMHLDEEAGKESILGGLSASGWHTCAMFMRMLCDAFLLDSTSQGSPGIEHVKWKKPVLAGDTLRGTATILAKRQSKSRPQLGLVSMRSELVNQRGESVFELENTGMFLARDAAKDLS